MAKLIFFLLGCTLFVGIMWTFLRPLWRAGFRGLASLAGLMASALFAGLVYLLFF
jgi:hypothetical protein